MKKTISAFVISIILFTTSCSQYQLVPRLLNEKEQSDLLLQFPPNINEFSTGERVQLWIINQTSDIIWFPNDFEIKISIFNIHSKKWEIIKNGMTYLPKNGNVLLQSAQSKKNIGSISLLPIIPEKYFSATNKVAIQVSIAGYRYIREKKTNQQVSGVLIFEISKK